ncbi:phage major capsid protein [Myroides odoratus]|uniref:Predicted phage phi-C31 gp36 major capsid-like protein n=1 Tax=Myroides odoratus TaxID=256 RepID=A0A378RQE6_MYROD|nr:phage major capsid protein [Myroides odoratus]QQU04025.1 phage major capsid protein [Myroides odoratus]STZ28589.1 Predicted phage phi-C31 gp36 major capsid-like protein [Myroides odoratus]
MKKSDLLKQKRMALLQRQQAIYKLVEKENREVSPEEQTELDNSDTEISDLDGEIEKAEKHEERQRRFAGLAGASVGGGEGAEMEKIAKRFSFLKAARSITAGTALDGVEKEMNDEAVREAESLHLGFDTKNSFSIPASMVRATGQTVTEDSGKFGGKLVPTDINVVEGFIPRLFLEEVGASFLSGLVGNVSLPKFSDYEYKWLSEREKIILKAEEIDGPIMKPKRAGAGVSVSNQLLMQSSVAVENMLYNKLRQAAARALNKAALNGDGVKEPLGILNMTGVQLAKAVTEEEMSYEAAVELWGLIAGANADAGNEVFILNSKLAAAAKTTKKDAGSGRFVMENGLIDGQKTIVTNLVEELAGLQTLIYGNFSELYIGQWGGVNFTADTVTGASTGEVLLYSNLYADIQSANPEAFAVNKFLKA